MAYFNLTSLPAVTYIFFCNSLIQFLIYNGLNITATIIGIYTNNFNHKNHNNFNHEENLNRVHGIDNAVGPEC